MQAGLLASVPSSGAFPKARMAAFSGMCRKMPSSFFSAFEEDGHPVTVAGPQRFRTAFPFKPGLPFWSSDTRIYYILLLLIKNNPIYCICKHIFCELNIHSIIHNRPWEIHIPSTNHPQIYPQIGWIWGKTPGMERPFRLLILAQSSVDQDTKCRFSGEKNRPLEPADLWLRRSIATMEEEPRQADIRVKSRQGK